VPVLITRSDRPFQTTKEGDRNSADLEAGCFCVGGREHEKNGKFPGFLVVNFGTRCREGLSGGEGHEVIPLPDIRESGVRVVLDSSRR